MMQLILPNLKKKYDNKLNVLFVHVRGNQILGARFGIHSIPVQIFLGNTGRRCSDTGVFARGTRLRKNLLRWGSYK